MPDLTPLEAAEKLEWMAKITEVDAFICNRDDIPLLKQSASYLRRVASGEYAPVIHGRWIHKDCNGIPTENHISLNGRINLSCNRPAALRR